VISLVDTGLIFGIFLCVLLFLKSAGDLYTFRKGSSRKGRRQITQRKWRVEIAPATGYIADIGHHISWKGTPRPVSSTTAVRITRSASEKHVIGTVDVTDENFEEQLQALIHKAQDRAATLNAYEDGVI